MEWEFRSLISSRYVKMIIHDHRHYSHITPPSAMPQTSWADVLKKTGPVSSHSVGVAGTALIHKVPTLYERTYPGVAELLDSPAGLAFAVYNPRNPTRLLGSYYFQENQKWACQHPELAAEFWTKITRNAIERTLSTVSSHRDLSYKDCADSFIVELGHQWIAYEFGQRGYYPHFHFSMEDFQSNKVGSIREFIRYLVLAREVKYSQSDLAYVRFYLGPNFVPDHDLAAGLNDEPSRKRFRRDILSFRPVIEDADNEALDRAISATDSVFGVESSDEELLKVLSSNTTTPQ